MGWSNYPDGVSGGDDYFNEPDPPECMNRKCCATLEPDWEFCPFCGWHIDWDDYAEEGGDAE